MPTTSRAPVGRVGPAREDPRWGTGRRSKAIERSQPPDRSRVRMVWLPDRSRHPTPATTILNSKFTGWNPSQLRLRTN